MKKSTILLIAVVFAVSVFVVGIFGIKNVPYNQRIYVEEITLRSLTLSNGKTVDIKQNDNDGSYYVRIEYEEDLSVMVNYTVTPNNATNRNLNITVDNSLSSNSNAEKLPNGAILLKDSGPVKITFIAEDSANKPKVILTIYTK